MGQWRPQGHNHEIQSSSEAWWSPRSHRRWVQRGWTARSPRDHGRYRVRAPRSQLLSLFDN